MTSCNNSLKVVLYAGLLFLAAFFLYLPSELGAALAIPPDSSEYSICLANLFEHGRFGFTLNGEWYPSRYAPWFSLLCLTPAYFLSGGNVLCLHWAILAFALVLLVAIWRIGRMLGLGKLAILPPILLMFMPDFVFYSRVVMTEIPYAALFAILALAFVRFANREQITGMFCFGIGLLIAWSGLIRSTGFALILPFAVVVFFRRLALRRKAVLVAMMAIPIVIAQLVGLAYNWAMFGSPFRSGYNYWMPVPFDFSNLVFSLGYVKDAVEYYFCQPIVLMSIAFLLVLLLFSVFVILTKRAARYKTLLLLGFFVAIHAAVLMALYLGYYWADARFFLPITISSLVLFFCCVNELLAKVGVLKKFLTMLAVFCVGILVVVNAPARYLYMLLGRYVWMEEAKISGSVLPAGSIVIQKGDPNIIEYFAFRNRDLTLYPVDRNFDYVSHMTASRCITDLVEQPESWYQFVLPELVSSGICIMPFPSVFEENHAIVREFLAKGKRVFYLRSHWCRNEEFESVKSRIESAGMKLDPFGAWGARECLPNPVRHLYDKLLFDGYSMDSRPEVPCVYYEIVFGENNSSDRNG